MQSIETVQVSSVSHWLWSVWIHSGCRELGGSLKGNWTHLLVWDSKFFFFFFLIIIAHLVYFTEFVAEHWREDDFFGYQFLNGFNPNRIKKCSELPKNFPVTEEMVKPSLKEGSSLKEAMEV